MTREIVIFLLAQGIYWFGWAIGNWSGSSLEKLNTDRERRNNFDLRCKYDRADRTLKAVEDALNHPAVKNGTEGAGFHVRKALDTWRYRK